MAPADSPHASWPLEEMPCVLWHTLDIVLITHIALPVIHTYVEQAICAIYIYNPLRILSSSALRPCTNTPLREQKKIWFEIASKAFILKKLLFCWCHLN